MTSVVSLGSNLGDRRSHLRAGVELLAARFPLRALSPVYETDPVGTEEQPPYLNVVALLDTDDAEGLLTAAHDAEQLRGRLRPQRWAPRTLDVDLVTVDALQSADPRLTLPHPRAHERAFVLVPWLDIEPDAVLPGHGSVRRLVARLGRAGTRRWTA